VTNDAAVIYLNNKLIKDRKQLDVLGDDLSKRSAELEKLESTVKSIENTASPDYDKAKEVGGFESKMSVYCTHIICA
jgi:hypothetical protein